MNEQGEFVESPLGLYLTALTFLHSGERENQRVAARRLSETLRLQEEIVGPVRAEAFDGLGDLAPDDARLLLVAFAGRGPSKQIARFGPIPIADYPIYIELPVLRWYPSEASSVRATLTPAQGGGDATVVTLGLVEQIGRVAHENHRRQMPLVYTRAFARATIRALAGRAAIRAVRRSTSNDLLVLGAYIGALAIPAITEKADTRAWAMLPGEAFVAAAGPEPGEYSVLLEWLSPTGGVVFSKRGRVVVPEEGMATVLEHYWR